MIFSLELELSGVAVQRIRQNREKSWLLLRENDFELVLANFCYDFDDNASEAVQKVLQIKKIIANAPRVL